MGIYWIFCWIFCVYLLEICLELSSFLAKCTLKCYQINRKSYFIQKTFLLTSNGTTIHRKHRKWTFSIRNLANAFQILAKHWNELWNFATVLHILPQHFDSLKYPVLVWNFTAAYRNFAAAVSKIVQRISIFATAWKVTRWISFIQMNLWTRFLKMW